jgi:predicted MPP superfamily phosphohydrolase
MFFLLIIPALLIADLLWWRWSDRRVRAMRVSRTRSTLRLLIAIFMAAQIAGYLYVIGARWVGVRASLPAALLAQVYVWHLLILPITVVAYGIASIVSAVFAGLRNRKRRGEVASSEVAPALAVSQNLSRLTRREVLLATAAALPPIIATTSTIGALSRLDAFRVRRMDIPLAGLPAALDGMTIAHVSDVHVGRFTHKKVLAAIAETTNSLRADLVLMTGDLIDFSLSDLPDALEMVRRIDPRSGLFTIEGNHDLFEGHALFEQRVQSAGIPLLLNDSATVNVRGFDVQLLGIRWGGGGSGPARQRGANFEQHLSATLPLLRHDRDVFPILLAHHPHAFDGAADAGIPLTLAGHTHGGQLMLTERIGAGSIMFKYWSGLYRRNNSALVVSNGVGNWFPLRINAPAEIVHITLRRV